MVVVNLAFATICFMNSCYPALVGETTPKGQYQLTWEETSIAGYGGDIIKFKETNVDMFAIHRVYLLKPEQHRLERIANPDPAVRVITNGCINVMPEVYEKLRKCCSKDKLLII